MYAASISRGKEEPCIVGNLEAPKNRNPAEPELCGVLSTTSGGRVDGYPSPNISASDTQADSLIDTPLDEYVSVPFKPPSTTTDVNFALAAAPLISVIVSPAFGV